MEFTYRPPWENFVWHKCSKQENMQYNLKSEIWVDVDTEYYKKLNKLRTNIEKYETSSKEMLNHTEVQIDNCWEYYKKIINPYEFVYTQTKYANFPKSISLVNPLSRSYFKMIEILQLTKYIEKLPFNFRTAHVCEGPGGFIEAIFNEQHNARKHILSSTAMTLKPKQVNVPGWKRAANFLQNNKAIKIIYGDDGTGNILNYDNQNAFIQYCKTKVHIFTADGGFDFSTDYAHQEQQIFPLLVASTRIGLECLKRGGMFVLKIFDFNNTYTCDLLYFLSTQFKEWTLYKPSISRPCNPEHYFIGNGFILLDELTTDALQLWSRIVCNGDPLNSLYRDENEGRKLFNTIINKIQNNSFISQVNFLERVFSLIDSAHKEEQLDSYIKQHQITSYNWCKKFGIPIYPPRHHLIEVLRNDLRVSSQ